ncbi:MAG: glycosyltransferase family 39 protein [Acidobacteria bacterium]|nr:glycosyltransferase family 39 protein [Acidobacteriota bacterium]MCK6684060.1 hypothetical protein [Thermoanaerobaculia bacterium]
MREFEKTAAALIASLSVLVFFHSLKRIVDGGALFLGTVTFAFGTGLFSTASQGLWPFTGELLFLCSALYFMLHARSRSVAAAAAGASIAGAFLCRPTAILLLPAFLPLLSPRRRVLFTFATGLSGGLLLTAAIQKALLGSWLGPYIGMNSGRAMWNSQFSDGLSGTLLSPSRGLMPFFPYLVVAAIVALRGRQELSDKARVLACTALGISAPVLVASLYGKWWGGDGLGPRLLSETAPFCALLTALAFFSSVRGWLRYFLVGLVAFSCATQALLAYRPIGIGWNAIVRPDDNPELLHGWRDSQLIAVWLPRWTPSPEFRLDEWKREDPQLHGSVDHPTDGGQVIGPLVVRGWARVPGEDLDVEVRVNGTVIRDSLVTRHARPDVAAAFPNLGDCSKAGYQIVVSPSNRTRRRVRLVVVFRSQGGQVRHYPAIACLWDR